MIIYLLEAEHPTVPGKILKAFQSFEGAHDEALSCVNTMTYCTVVEEPPDYWAVENDCGDEGYIAITILEVEP